MAAIFLVGFMGSGKSTVGRALAERLGWPFRDLDEIIEAVERESIPRIFETRGERVFREIESAALREQITESRAGGQFVLALGGGAFAEAVNREQLAGEATVWLDCPFERAQARVARDPHRPNARDPERFARLFAERLPAYAQARYRVPIDSDDPQPVINVILSTIPAMPPTPNVDRLP